MPKLITAAETKSLLKQLGITQAEFSEKYGVSIEALKAIFSEKTKLTKEKQEDFIDTLKKLGGNKGNQALDTVKIQREFAEWAYNAIANWIKTENLDTLAAYWNNLDSTYMAIDVQATQFLYHCCDITAPTSKVDRRLELLTFIQDFSSSVSAIQKAMPTIKVFLNADENFKQKEVNYKKSKIYTDKDNPDVVKQYRDELGKQFEKLFYESESNKAAIIYNQADFITTMDKTDWELLIAYTLVRADDESGEKLQ